MNSVRRNRRAAALVSVALGAACASACSDSGSASEPAVDASTVVDAGGSASSDANAPAFDAASATDSAAGDAGAPTTDASSPSDAAPVDAAPPSADAGLRCTAAATDDGTAEASTLAARNISCHFRSNEVGWEGAAAYCAGFGSGWRLASKGVALKIASNPEVCRIAVSTPWHSWTSTCAGGNLAWAVQSNGNSGRSSTTGGTIGVGVLCVRNP